MRSTKAAVGRPSGDGAEQRARLSEAAWSVIAERGLEGASMRAIARELGATTGVISHYFTNKQQLLHFAISARLDALHERLERAAGIQPAREAIRALALEALPVDPQMRLEWSVYLSFLSQSPRNLAFRQEIERRHAKLREISRRVIRRGQADGSFADDLDVDLFIDQIQGAVEGIGLLAVVDPERFDADRQRELIDRLIASAAVEGSMP